MAESSSMFPDNTNRNANHNRATEWPEAAACSLIMPAGTPFRAGKQVGATHPLDATFGNMETSPENGRA